MSRHLQRDIENLKNKILQMGEDVEDRVYRATLSIVQHNEKMALDVKDNDAEIDAMEVEIEETCLSILALYQPVAIDLRFIITVLKINNELERVGDLAVNIAERSAFMALQDEVKIPFDITGMALKAESMLTRSIDCLINMDVHLAYKIRSEDDDVDALNQEMYARLNEAILSNPEQINYYQHALSVGRHLERIADHATNIAEEVIYLVDAEIVRHTPEDFVQ
ncbi:phosphate transport system regulatory protein PhoU [Desulfocapsa sulfexigens DSM 10523]|uniref:Phosphate-specific transport system accessory protein PhoU n=1 Tax=Desulfocapsa sulfexigens (strain DSM 10523 / SB164P1) TaxID=1167006 RepID=M1NCW0_DESSD|nr:phosphate signaling complex protein PhoU [Desulfocapsa sulfexigens]AGF77584.1 phosphate transport system regulatory protein PhoU [Desulfocapsa sulfexigens DSM 10523]